MSRADLPAWLLTYAVHSTLLIGAVWLLVRRGIITSHHLQDTFWKAALVGGVLTATAQTALGIRPAGTVAIQPVAVAAAPTSLADLPAPTPMTARSLDPAPPSHSAAPAGTTSTPPLPLGATVLYLWLGLAVLCLLQLLIARMRLSWRIGPREPLTGSPLDVHVATLCRAAGIRRPIRLTAAEGLMSPVALGRSEICIPRAVLTDLDPAQQRSVLAHELAHLTRFDPLWLTAACIIERVFFFQPLNRVARRRMQEAAEYLCDDWAVIRTGSGLTMAKSLVKVAEWMHTPALPLPLSGMAETPSQLVARVRRLVDERQPLQGRRRWQVPAAFAIVGITAVMVPGVRPNAPSPAAAAVPSVPAVAALQDTTRPRPRRTPRPEIAAVQVAMPTVAPTPTPTPTPTPVIAAVEPAMVSAGIAAGVRAAIAGNFSRSSEPQDTARQSQRVAVLVAALRDSDVEVRRAAANSLGQIEDRRAVPGLIIALGDADAEVRQQAARALAQLEDKRAVPGLITALHDADAEVRRQAAWALAQLEDRRATEPLIAALRDADVEVRRKSAWALGQLEDQTGAPALAAALRDDDADVRRNAAWSLGQLELRAAPAELIDALKDPNADVRRTAAWALSETGDARAVPALRRMLSDTDADARKNAIRALGQIRDSSAMQAIIEAMKSSDAEVRRAAAQALGDR